MLDGDDRRARRRARRGARRVTRALGPVRELDVAAGHFDEVLGAHPLGAAARTAARQVLRTDSVCCARRGACRADARASVEALGEPRAALARDVHRRRARRVGRCVDDPHCPSRPNGVRKAVDLVGVVYMPERLHAVRIAVKRLRYALEVAADARRGRGTAQLQQLRAIQELLGRAHDLHVLAERLREVQRDVVTVSRATARDLGRLAREIDRACRAVARVVHEPRAPGCCVAGDDAGRTCPAAACRALPVGGLSVPTSLELYLVRHAVAAERGPDYPDDALRPLTPEGVDPVAARRDRPARTGARPRRRLTSPFVRARDTAEILCAGLQARSRGWSLPRRWRPAIA